MGKPEELSNAQCLRVIGQYLDGHPTNTFRLRTFGASYIVSSDDLGKAPVPGFLSRIRQRILSSDDPPASDYLVFTRSEIFELNLQRQTDRESGSTIDGKGFSIALRVLGDYFDRRNIEEFAIDWTENSIIARYGTRQESFTRSELYNFGVRMYLRRADRAH